jgi:superfamily II DNA or RNA helicase
VARALARSLLPAERACEAPPWLLPGQIRSFRRAFAALARFGGALLADPVGSGKTYVALAVAAAWGRHPACLVPATLAHQWSRVAQRLGVTVEIGTHQQASRGRLPQGPAGLVVIDESHHFRNPRTRRYGHVARWLLGRRVLLLSATPIVNRLDDLAHQLLLGVRDDALLADGVVSLRAALVACVGIPALGRLVVEDTREAGPRPARAPAASEATSEEDECARATLKSLDRLRLSRHSATAALIRTALLRAAASSPPALLCALRRYRGLLLHAADASRAGRRLSRTELRELAGELEDQLVMWELVPDGGGELELALADLETIDEVLAATSARAARSDVKLQRLQSLLADGRPTLVFTTRRETVRHLRDRLAPAPAWCTGDRAGLGRAPAARATVMRWFQEAEHAGAVSLPRCLVATDVAAEGLDLRRAERVVHYDLPWTPMRLEQREGRAVRLGSQHRCIEVVRFGPPAALEAALRLGDRLERKAGLPAHAGLGPGGVRLWRWRSALADRLSGGPAVAGTAMVRGADCEGLLAGFALLAGRQEGREPLATVVGWLDRDGHWTEEEHAVGDRLLEAARSDAHTAVPGDAAQAALDALMGPVRTRLVLASGRRWAAGDPAPCARRLAERLGQAVAEAARARDQITLGRLERAMGFVGGGHTAGEAMLVERMAQATRRELTEWLARVPVPTPRWDTLEVRLTGLVLFRSDGRLGDGRRS